MSGAHERDLETTGTAVLTPESEPPVAPTPTDARAQLRAYQKKLAPYQAQQGDDRRSALQLIVTATGFATCWIASYLALQVGWWLTLLAAVPTALFLVKLFILQHDCGHGSFFRSQKLADTVGFWIGVLTVTPYRYWRRTHNGHHSYSGDLDGRGIGDIDTWTLEEYQGRSAKAQFWYRVYRSPVVLFAIGPAFHFLIKHRFPWDTPRSWKREWAGIWKTNLAMAAAILAMGWLVGFGSFFAVQLPVTLLASSFGVWLFYVQHQFEDTYWRKRGDWDPVQASLQGSSYLEMPGIMQWLTGSIGLHHIHHLCSRIPNYRLQKCMDENPDMHRVTKLGLVEGLRSCGLQLWDEKQGKLISFRAAKRQEQAS